MRCSITRLSDAAPRGPTLSGPAHAKPSSPLEIGVLDDRSRLFADSFGPAPVDAALGGGLGRGRAGGGCPDANECPDAVRRPPGRDRHRWRLPPCTRGVCRARAHDSRHQAGVASIEPGRLYARRVVAGKSLDRVRAGSGCARPRPIPPRRCRPAAGGERPVGGASAARPPRRSRRRPSRAPGASSCRSAARHHPRSASARRNPGARSDPASSAHAPDGRTGGCGTAPRCRAARGDRIRRGGGSRSRARNGAGQGGMRRFRPHFGERCSPERRMTVSAGPRVPHGAGARRDRAGWTRPTGVGAMPRPPFGTPAPAAVQNDGGRGGEARQRRRAHPRAVPPDRRAPRYALLVRDAAVHRGIVAPGGARPEPAREGPNGPAARRCGGRAMRPGFSRSSPPRKRNRRCGPPAPPASPRRPA